MVISPTGCRTAWQKRTFLTSGSYQRLRGPVSGISRLRPVARWGFPVVAALGIALVNTGILSAGARRMGFLAAETSFKDMGPHNRAAWETAKKLGQATLLLRQTNGSFVDSSGNTQKLDSFDVLWYHQGDAIRRTAMYRGPSLTGIRQFAAGGRGVFLSGGALAMVAQLGLETTNRSQRHDMGNYREPAGAILVEPTHPAFVGLKTDDTFPGVWLSRGGCRAVADFYWGGPAEGMVLAKTPTGPENPLVEYQLGQGRVIVFGWHWPDYADAESPYSSNLIRLTSNLLNYLADKTAWQPVVIRSKYPPLASRDEPGVLHQEWRALRLAIEDLSTTFPNRYPTGGEYLNRWKLLQAEQNRLSPSTDAAGYIKMRQQFEALKQDALLANPLLDFDHLLMIRRRADCLGLPVNFNGNADIEPTGYDNTLVSLSPVRPDGKLETIFQPEGDRFVGDIDLDYEADRLLLSMPDASGRWGISELDLVTRQLKRLSLIDDPDVHNYDACYLPDGRIVFTSTAPFIGVPCVGGKSKVANLYVRECDGQIHRLTNDQDHNWCPTVLNDGQLLYQRWEYTGLPHAFSRLLFQAHPDGSHQVALYGSNSYWPTTMFYARPIPGHPTKLVAVIGGHHEAPRQGELVIFDPAQGRQEADGAVQRIPGFRNKVEPVILDGLIGNSWPRFLHPFPLSDKYFLVACKPTKTALWGVYLVDVFDNFVLLHEEPGRAMLEPIPLRKTRRPPIVADVVQSNQKEATLLLLDVYRGNGLRGVPRGTVKSLRLISYDFAFHGMGGEPYRVGFDGPWDVKRILGTVPVEPDGSAYFHVPALTPVAVQPLDAEGKALALMRSWYTALPGEAVSCVGCHESSNTAPPSQPMPLAAQRAPSRIQPWYGPARGFSFVREVQPVLDAYCVRCHDGKPLEDGRTAFDLTDRPIERVASTFRMYFSPSYTALHRFVHIPTLESDAHLLSARDYHADTSKLVQILRDGHYGVRLSHEAWDRLITWIDLNAPAHGTWGEVVNHFPDKVELARQGAARRRELHRRYAGIDEDPEAIHPAATFPKADRRLSRTKTGSRNGGSTWNTGAATSVERSQHQPNAPNQQNAHFNVSMKRLTQRETLRVSLADDVTLELVSIPSGQFVMGSEDGYPNERPAHPVVIDKPFWMGRCEMTNQQYACFDPAHDSGLETGEQYAFGDYERGHHLDRPEQPVVRVSWNQAVAFCRWLSEKTGMTFDLPTEAQWEYACRAGTTSPLWYGTLDDDFSRSDNLSDATHHTVDYPHVPTALPPWRPADTRFDDHWRVSAPVSTFKPNAWGLYDMHGNVSEWTASDYRLYPDSKNGTLADSFLTGRKTVRGGSWLDRPRRARSAFRLHYQASQAVHNVGFRVVCIDTQHRTSTADGPTAGR